MRGLIIRVGTICAVVLTSVSGAGFDEPDEHPAVASHRSPSATVAVVGEREITRAMLESAVRRSLGSRYFHRDVAADRLADLERKELQSLIRRELNLLGGLEKGLELPMEKGWEVQRAQEQAGGENYRESLAASGITAEDHARLVAETMLADTAFRQFVTDAAKVDDAEVKAAYEADAASWYMPSSLHLQHILVSVPPSAETGGWGAAEEEAEALRERIEGGEAFDQVAAAASDDMYRIKGGDLGWVHRGRLVKTVEDAVWSAEVGELVGPVRITEGFHLARALDRRDRRQLSLDEAGPMIRGQLEEQRLTELEQRWYDGLRERYPVIIKDPVLAGD